MIEVPLSARANNNNNTTTLCFTRGESDYCQRVDSAANAQVSANREAVNSVCDSPLHSQRASSLFGGAGAGSDTDDSARARSPSPASLVQHAACTSGASCTRTRWASAHTAEPAEDVLCNPLIGSITVPCVSVDAMLEAQTRASCAAGKDCSDEADQHVDGAEEAFFVADLGQLVRRHVTWQRALPRIDPFYAMKCNPNPVVLSVLARLGANFDCASRAEIEAVLSLGVSPDRIIYANPCKSLSHLRYAREMGVRMVTFDNADELHKIQRAHPQAQCVLRILTDDTRSVCQLGLKFGAPLHTTRALIALARDLHLNLVGVSFHVGSGCRDAETFGDAVHRARRVFDEARDYGYEMTLLDCGGGFPGLDPAAGAESSVTFQQVSQILSRAIDEDFPAGSGVRIIGEPGRFYAASAFTLAVNVTARREPIASAGSQSNAPIMYYLNDGVYGSFNCLVFDHAVCHPRLLVKSGQFQPSGSAQQDGPLFECSLWGPTCDSIDCITRSVQLPRLSVGDWLAFDAMGAYTLCAASNFNGFCKSAIQYVNTLGTAGAGDAEDEAKALWQAKVVQ